MANKPSTISYDPEARPHEAIASCEQARDEGLDPDPAGWSKRSPERPGAGRVAPSVTTSPAVPTAPCSRRRHAEGLLRPAGGLPGHAGRAGEADSRFRPCRG